MDGLLTHKHDEKELDGVVQSEDEASAGRSHGGNGHLAPFFLGYGAGVEETLPVLVASWREKHLWFFVILVFSLYKYSRISVIQFRASVERGYRSRTDSVLDK